MRYGVTLPSHGNVHDLVDLGVAAEAAGWDGVFIWDCLDTNDPWVTLAAIAGRTSRVRLGPLITPPSRRRPLKLAQETATLDQLSNGRLIFPVGLGAVDSGFARAGEVTDRATLAARLDESLAILAGLWSGQPFSYHGQHFQVEEWTFTPTPVQQPRPPVWVVGAWPRPKSMRRALQWDGILPIKMPGDGTQVGMTPDDIRAMRAYIAEHRIATTPFDIIMEGETPGDDPAQAAAIIGPLAEAGVTWWLENVWGTPEDNGGVAGMRARIDQGPPRGA